jgi:hypothetical protein
MNFKHNLLVITPSVLNLRFMNNGSSELGVKKLKELKLVSKLLLSSENLILDLYMSTLILLFFNLLEKLNVLKDNIFKFQKLLESFFSKKKNSRCTSMNYNMSSMNIKRFLEKSNQSPKISYNLILKI